MSFQVNYHTQRFTAFSVYGKGSIFHLNSSADPNYKISTSASRNLHGQLYWCGKTRTITPKLTGPRKLVRT